MHLSSAAMLQGCLALSALLQPAHPQAPKRSLTFAQSLSPGFRPTHRHGIVMLFTRYELLFPAPNAVFFAVSQDMITSYMKGYPGELLEEPFVDFSTTRNYALRVRVPSNIVVCLTSSQALHMRLTWTNTPVARHSVP